MITTCTHAYAITIAGYLSSNTDEESRHFLLTTAYIAVNTGPHYMTIYVEARWPTTHDAAIRRRQRERENRIIISRAYLTILATPYRSRPRHFSRMHSDIIYRHISELRPSYRNARKMQQSIGHDMRADRCAGKKYFSCPISLAYMQDMRAAIITNDIILYSY